jgi:hypothetical protein
MIFSGIGKCVVVYSPIDEPPGRGKVRDRLFDNWFNKLHQHFKCNDLQKERLAFQFGDKVITVTLYFKEDHRAVADHVISNPTSIINLITT